MDILKASKNSVIGDVNAELTIFLAESIVSIVAIHNKITINHDYNSGIGYVQIANIIILLAIPIAGNVGCKSNLKNDSITHV